MKIGYVGLGKMGKNMVLRLLDHGIEVVAWNRSPLPLAEVKAAGAEVAKDMTDLVSSLPTPKIVWLMLPAGDTTEEYIKTLKDLLSVGDLVIDGGNSFFKDSIRRHEEFAEKGIKFVDVGVSGGPDGARNGACLMVGGGDGEVTMAEQVFGVAASLGSWLHLGPSGAGHYAKMVHNGIEYGMMQAIAEGVAVLKFGPYKFDLKKVAGLFNKGSVIESKLLDWTSKALMEDPELTSIDQQIQASGEGAWTVQVASELGVEVPVISKSLEIRNTSREVHENRSEKEIYRNKVVSALRGQFGKHNVQAIKS